MKNSKKALILLFLLSFSFNTLAAFGTKRPPPVAMSLESFKVYIVELFN